MRTLKKFAIGVLAAIACLQAAFAVAQEEGARSDLLSHLQARKANWESLVSFDVLFRTDLLRGPAVSSGHVETTFERLVLDTVNNRCLYVKSGERERLTGGDQAKLGMGFILSNRNVRSFKSPGVANKVQRVQSQSKLFDQFGVPDLRLVMFMKHGREGNTVWQDDRFSAFETFARQAVSVQRRMTVDGPLLSMAFKNGVGYQWQFDSRKLVPKNATWRIQKPDGTWKQLGREEYEWSESNGIQLPLTISSQFVEPEFPDGMEPTPELIKKHLIESQINRDVQFAWISVNKTLPEERFDFDQLNSVSEFLALTDPVEQGVPVLTDDE